MQTTLYLVPCRTRLMQAEIAQIGDLIGQALSPYVSDVQVNDPIEPGPSRIHPRRIDGQIFEGMEFKIAASPSDPTVWDLTRHLGMTLIITDVYLFSPNNNGLRFAYRLKNWQQAIISTAPIIHDPEKIVSRLVPVGTHEVGHILGLGHHDPPNLECVMTTGEQIAEHYGIQDSALHPDPRIYDLMPLRLCTDCYKSL